MSLAPDWFNVPDSCLEEEELREKLEYEKSQLELLKIDIANTEVRIADIAEKLGA